MNKEYYPLYIVIPVYALGFILLFHSIMYFYTLTGSWLAAILATAGITHTVFLVTLLAIMRGIK